MILRRDVNTTAPVDGKGIAYPAVTGRFSCLVFSTLSVVQTDHMVFSKIATDRRNIPMFSGND